MSIACSAVIGLQKRGLRGLMEGRRLREQAPVEQQQGQSGGAGGGGGGMSASGTLPPRGGAEGGDVGLGIAPS